MTLKELSQLFYLNREIEVEKERLEQLKSEAQGISGGKFTGMPCASGHTSDKLARCIAEIVDTEAIIASKLVQCLHERSRLERYISEIDDSLTRMIFTYRFINGLPWEQVAACIGGNNTDKSVSKACYRYLERHHG